MRARNIKPGFFTNELLATSDPLFAWVYAGMWCMADRDGRLEDRPRHIHLTINPGRAYEGTVDSLNWLIEHGFVRRYSVNGATYLEILSFGKHQNPHVKETARFPPPNGTGSGEYQTGPGPAPDSTADMSGAKHGASMVQVPEQHQSSPADSLLLIPDSGILNPESSSLRSESSVAQERDDDGHDPPRRVFEHWQAVHAHPRSHLGAKRRKLILARLKEGYSEADLCQAISGYKHSPHHMGVNPNGTVYDTLELILRDAAHVDTGLKLYQNPPRSDLSEKTRRGIAQTEEWEPPEVRRARH